MNFVSPSDELSPQNKSILIVQNVNEQRNDLVELLKNAGYEVVESSTDTSNELLQIQQQSPTLIVKDQLKKNDIKKGESTSEVRNHLLFESIVEIYTTPIVINKNTVIYSIIHDITERVEAEKKLNDQLDELQRWHKVTLGREIRIIELISEINHLLQKLGQQKKYNSIEE